MARGRRIKLVWGSTAKYPEYRSLGLWLIDARATDAKVKGVAINLRALFWWTVALLAVAYVGVGQQWYSLQHRRAHSTITRIDALLLPFRWTQVREKIGRAEIAEGLDDLRAQRWGEGQVKLRAGLARAPHDPQARLELASLYSASGRRSAAMDLLMAELKYGYPGREFLSGLFRIASDGEDYAQVITICDGLRTTVPASDRPWLLTEKLRALIAAGAYEQVIQTVDAEGSGANGDVREAKVLALQKLGRCDQALAYLEAWGEIKDANRVQLLRLRAQVAREGGRIDTMKSALTALRALAPAAPRVAIFSIVQEVLARRNADAAAGLEDYLWRFGGSSDNLLLAAAELDEAGAATLVQRCVDEAEAHGFPAIGYLQSLADAQVGAGDWVAAARTIAKLAALREKGDFSDHYFLLWMQRLIAATSPGDGSQIALLEVLRDRPIGLRMYRRTCQVMIAAGHLDTAAKACALGQNAFPASRSLRELSGEIARCVAAQKPIKTVPVVVEPGVPDEASFFRQLAELTQAAKWDDAAALVQKVRAFQPDWSHRREAAVLDWDMRIASRTDDVPELIGAARLFLTGSKERADRVLSLAEEVRRGGAKEHANTLVAEVLRRMPDYEPALKLRALWQPGPVKKS